MGLIPSRWPGLVVNEDRVVADEGGLLDSYEHDAYGIRALEGVEFAIDVGAHLGGATALLHERFPKARIIAVECCPENMLALIANVGAYAEVVQAAVTYEPGELVLASTVYEGCGTSGSSVVVSRDQWEAGAVLWTWDALDYHLDDRPLAKVTIAQLMDRFAIPRIDFLKLDCEGSEISILRESSAARRVPIIAGEYHDEAMFLRVTPPDAVLEIRDGHLFTIRQTGVTCA